jgi:hypothetical protein
MTVRLLGSLLAAAICVVATVGCGSDPDSAPKKKDRVCDRGTVFSCYARGCNGHQFCNEDGTKMSACACDSAPAADGGSPASDRDAQAAPDASEVDAADRDATER